MFALNATADPELLGSLTQNVAKLVFGKFRLNITTNPVLSYAAGINSILSLVSLVSTRDWATKLNTSDFLAGGMDRMSVTGGMAFVAVKAHKFYTIKSSPLRNKEIWRSWIPVVLAISLALN